MAFNLTAKERKLLAKVHPDMRAVIERAAQLSDNRFRVIEGMRTKTRQAELFRTGKSKTMNSRHLTGHAVDVVPYFDVDEDGDVDGQDLFNWTAYYPLADTIKKAARELGVPIQWGGDWRKFKDGPHWQLTWAAYPLDNDTHRAQVQELGAPMSERTSRGDMQIAVGGGSAGAVVAAEPLGNVIALIQNQQENLSSGDMARIAIAAVIVGLTVFMVLRR